MARADGDYQVAVIGAGPMGSFAAERLARAGLRVLMLERDPVPGTSTVCGGGMHIEVSRYTSLPESVIERQLTACRLVVSGKVREWRFPTTQYVTIKRLDLDRYLAERAVKAGASLRTSALVKEGRPSEQIVRYEETGTGRLCDVRADVFVFADGPIRPEQIPHSLAFRTIPDLKVSKAVRRTHVVSQTAHGVRRVFSACWCSASGSRRAWRSSERKRHKGPFSEVPAPPSRTGTGRRMAPPPDTGNSMARCRPSGTRSPVIRGSSD